jgi:hypothetical protein
LFIKGAPKAFVQKILGAIGALLISGGCLSDTLVGSFNVNISLTNPGSCLSETLSRSTGAAVQVVCQSSQFVRIDPQPGKPFLGVHGGAFRYLLGPGSTLAAQSAGMANPFVGAGTVTELRIFNNADGSDGPLEILISF